MVGTSADFAFSDTSHMVNSCTDTLSSQAWQITKLEPVPEETVPMLSRGVKVANVDPPE